MSATIPALIRLLPAVNRFRATGWRGTCEFDGVVAPGLAARLIYEAIDPSNLGEASHVTLRLWVPGEMKPRLRVGQPLRILEGNNEVATGEVELQFVS